MSKKILLFAFTITALVTLLSAQQTTATISGTVTDSSGALVPNNADRNRQPASTEPRRVPTAHVDPGRGQLRQRQLVRNARISCPGEWLGLCADIRSRLLSRRRLQHEQPGERRLIGAESGCRGR